MEYVRFEDLKDKTLKSIAVGRHNGEDNIVFEDEQGVRYEMYHAGDCCETVEIEEIVGNIEDLLGSSLLMAEEVSYENETPDYLDSPGGDSYTWTFYKLATLKGYVTIRWLGTSNGYYSESVSFRKID